MSETKNKCPDVTFYHCDIQATVYTVIVWEKRSWIDDYLIEGVLFFNILPLVFIIFYVIKYIWYCYQMNVYRRNAVAKCIQKGKGSILK